MKHEARTKSEKAMHMKTEFETWAADYFEDIFGNAPFLRDCNDVDADRTYQKYEVEDAYQAWQSCQQLNDEVIASKDAEIARLRDVLLKISQQDELNGFLAFMATKALEKNDDK